MGHIRLGTLPRSRQWREVVNELQLGADVDLVAAATANAAEADLANASDEPAFLHSFWLLTQIPLAARGPEFANDLRRLGLEVTEQPSLMTIVGALSGAVDTYARIHGGRSDLGEMAQMAAVESLMAVVGPRLPTLFGPSPSDVQRAFGQLASGDQFSALAREFFSRLTQRTLGYYLSRELASHTGDDLRFRNDSARSNFDDALGRHCWETSRIIQDYAGDWYGKTVYRAKGMTPRAVRHFAPLAFEKIRAELRKRRDAA